MIGYFATYDFNYKNIKYEIGKTYSIETDDIKKHGFKFFKELSNLSLYIKDNFSNCATIDTALRIKIIEFDVLGDVVLSEKNNMYFTNKLKVIREVPLNEHQLFTLEKDDNGNYTYLNFYGNEVWQTFDKDTTTTHYKPLNDAEQWITLKNGNMIYLKNKFFDEIYEIWSAYDDNGNIIYSKDSDGLEHWYEYNELNKIKYHKTNNGFEIWYTYDDKGNEIHNENNMNDYTDYTYDENNNLIHYKLSSGFEIWYTYDNKGNLTYTKDSSGYEITKEYDDNSNLIHFSNGKYEYFKKYEDNKLVYEKYINKYSQEKISEFIYKDNTIYYICNNHLEYKLTIEEL